MEQASPAGHLPQTWVARWVNPMSDMRRAFAERLQVLDVVAAVSDYCYHELKFHTELPMDPLEKASCSSDDDLKFDLRKGGGRHLVLACLFPRADNAERRLKIANELGVPAFVIYEATQAEPLRELLEHPNVVKSFPLDRKEDLPQLLEALDKAVAHLRATRSTLPAPEETA